MEIEEAKFVLLENIKNITSEKDETLEIISLTEALGRVAAHDITATVSVPYFPKSAMDGYAVRACDVVNASREHPVTLNVIGKIYAGEYKEYTYREKTAIRIMTGAYIPEGYNAVVMQEHTDYGEDSVNIFKAVSPYTNYCKVGEDIKKGDVILKKGTKCSRIHIGELASLGINELAVYRKLKVGILATGSELIETGAKPEKGKIYNSISSMLIAQLHNKGMETDDYICPDDTDLLVKLLKAKVQSNDIVITTGGVSVGEKDLLPKVLKNIGADVLFQRVNIKPGTPTIAAIYEGVPILCLSGNPYAALVNFDYYFWDVASVLARDESLKLKRGTAKMKGDYHKIEPKRRLLRAKEEGGVVTPCDVHSSSVISNMTDCNCYVEIIAETPVKDGDEVKIYYID